MSEWIDPNFKLPPLKKDVLVYMSNAVKPIAVARIVKFIDNPVWGVWSVRTNNVCMEPLSDFDILFWMELPAKPSWWNIAKAKRISRYDLMDLDD